jgi:hypothetical protein
VIAVAVVRFAVAIVFNALAFIVWDIGTRPPLQLARDLLRGVRIPASLGRGLVRFATGCMLLFLAAEVARPAMPTLRAFMLIETGMLIAALLVENLVGPDLRRRLRRPA